MAYKITLTSFPFMSLSDEYRDDFIKNLHDALSGHCRLLFTYIIVLQPFNCSTSVEEAVLYGEHSRVKCIGLTIETRPDYCLPKHLDRKFCYIDNSTNFLLCMTVTATGIKPFSQIVSTQGFDRHKNIGQLIFNKMFCNLFNSFL